MSGWTRAARTVRGLCEAWKTPRQGCWPRGHNFGARHLRAAALTPRHGMSSEQHVLRRTLRTGIATTAAVGVAVAGGGLARCLPKRDANDRVSAETMQACLEELQKLDLGDRLDADSSICEAHGDDYSFHKQASPDVVVYPESTEEVSKILAICNKHKVPVIPYGAGTSLEGHVLAVLGGVTLDMSLMKEILELNEADMDVTVQPGVSYNELNDELAEKGLFFPPDPGAGAFIGGMVGTGAGGTNAVLHGGMRDNVLSLEVVIPNGQVVHTRQRSKKSSAGYDLTHLFIGSEGTLGVVTKATLKLKPLPTCSAVATCEFDRIEDATRCVEAVVRAGVPVARMELLDELMVEAVRKSTGMELAERPLLLVEFSAGSKRSLDEHVEQVRRSAAASGGGGGGGGGGGEGGAGGRFTLAEDPERREELWRARKEALWSAYSLRPGSDIWTTDVCVPVSRLSEVIRDTKSDLASTELIAPIVAHAGDGNFHMLILVRPDDEEELRSASEFNARMVRRAIAAGGTCTGEHGVGEGKIEFLEEEHGREAVELMCTLKAAIDPNNIMNPGKVLLMPPAASNRSSSLEAVLPPGGESDRGGARPSKPSSSSAPSSSPSSSAVAVAASSVETPVEASA